MPLTLYAPMRDGDLNDAMVGLFSDWRVRIPSFWSKRLVRVEMEQLDTGGVYTLTCFLRSCLIQCIFNGWSDEPLNLHWTDQHPTTSITPESLRFQDLTVPCSSLVSLFGAPGSATVAGGGEVMLRSLHGHEMCCEAVGYDVPFRTTAPQVMRCVSSEGSTRRIELTQQTPKSSVFQSPLQGTSFSKFLSRFVAACSCTRSPSLLAWWLS